MIKQLKIILFFVLSMSLFNVVTAQNVKTDLIKVYEKFNKSPFKLEVRMEMKHWNASTPSSVTVGKVRRKGNNYYTSFAGRITLQNKLYSIIITKRDKNIIYVPLKGLKGKENQVDPLTMMNDTNLFKNVKLIKTDASGKTYEILKPQFGMKKMELKITPNNVLKEVKYYYEKTEESSVREVVITYNNVVFNPVFSSLDFSEKKYFKMVNGKQELTADYKGYHLYNARNHER